MIKSPVVTLNTGSTSSHVHFDGAVNPFDGAVTDQMSMSQESFSHADDRPGSKEVTMESTEGEENSVRQAAREAVVEANLGDLEELSNDIEVATVYSLRQDTLDKWTLTLRNTLTSIRNNLDGSRKGVTHQSHHHAKGARGKRRSMADVRMGLGDHGGSKRHLSTIPNVDRGLPVDALNQTARSSAESGKTNNTAGGTVAGGVYVLLEACATAIDADWGTCFVYQAKTEQLVLASGVGKRAAKPGSTRLPANVGVESHVLATGVAVNIAHAYVEEEFSTKLDKVTSTRTKTQLVFPLKKPGSQSIAFGVIEFGNKLNGTVFSPEDENRVAQCAQLVSLIITRYPSDITNSNSFDPSVMPKEEARAPSLIAGLNIPTNSPQTHLVYRTARVGHLKRSEVMRDAAGLSYVPTITEAIGHVTKVSEAWRNAVMLNMELEREVDRLQEALRVSRREITRLQSAAQDLKGELAQVQLMMSGHSEENSVSGVLTRETSGVALLGHGGGKPHPPPSAPQGASKRSLR